LAIDVNDNLYLTWGSGFPGYHIWFRKSLDGGMTWSDSIITHDDLGEIYGLVKHASLAVTSNGTNVYVAWSDSRRDPNSTYDIYFSKSTDGGMTWQPDVQVNDTLTNYDSYGRSSIVSKHNGNLCVAWHDYRTGNADIYVSCSPDNGITWRKNVRVNDDKTNTNQWGVSLAVDINGVLYTSWSDQRNGHDDIYISRSTNGGMSWSKNIKVNDDEGEDRQFDSDLIVSNFDRYLYLVWRDDRNGNYDIYFAYSADNGVTWSPNIKTNQTNDSTNQTHPDLAIGPNGNLFLVWSEEGSHTSGIYFARGSQTITK
jgi:Neuraminidase (sialidase)